MFKKRKVSIKFLSDLKNPGKLKSVGVASYQKSVSYLKSRPTLSFLIVLFLLFGLIGINRFLFSDKIETKISEPSVKEIQVFEIGNSPKMNMQAQIDKSGVIKITALNAGVVQDIKFQEGDMVKKGTTLLWMSSNYQGGNILSAQRQIAQTQNNNINQTYPTAKEIIKKQREIAEKTDVSNDDLRNITNQSLEDSRSLIGLNDDILNTLSKNQKNLEDTNVGGVNDAAILSTKQVKSQVQSANNQLRSGLRSAEYSSSSEKAPSQISDLQKDIALKQLDIQEKALDLNRDVSRLQLQLAQISEATMYPSAPCDGMIQKVHVKIGESVTPGTTLFTISFNNQSLTATTLVTREIAQNISRLEPATLTIGDTNFNSDPAFISTEAVSGQLYSVMFALPEEYKDKLTDKSFINIQIPVGPINRIDAIPFIPLDSIFQTQEDASVFVVDGDKVASKKIKLGEILGRFVEVKEGLNTNDKVILNRNVVNGDKIIIKN